MSSCHPRSFTPAGTFCESRWVVLGPSHVCPWGFLWACPFPQRPADRGWMSSREEGRGGRPPHPGGDACLVLRVLSFNNLTRLDEGSLADLSSLSVLRLSHNSISHIAEGAFEGLRSLRVLYVSPVGAMERGAPGEGGRGEQARRCLAPFSLAASQTGLRADDSGSDGAQS